MEVVADRLLEAVGRPFSLGSETIALACSLGFALYPDHGTTPETLMANSDRALYAAKERGKNCYAFFAR